MANKMLTKQMEIYKAGFEAGRETGMQEMWDYVMLALSRMYQFSRTDLDNVLIDVAESNQRYAKCCTADKEADYMQECLDKNLRESWGSDLPPYRVRYPYYKQFGYAKGRKNWK